MSFGSAFGGGGGFGANNNNTSAFGGGSGFGSNNNTSAFGQPAASTGAFGSPAPSTGTGTGIFGSGTAFGSTPAAGGGFGSTSNTSAFGAKPAFGAPSTGGGLFGSTPSTTASGSAFGGGFGSGTAPATSSPFGGAQSGGLFGQSAPKPAFGAPATGGTSGGLFGSAGQPASSGFGAFNSPASTALGGPVGDPPGTAGVPFQATVEKENASSTAQNSFQNILFQDAYKKWSSDELRLADYVQGRRFGPSAGSGFGSGFGGGFGANNNQGTGAFGSTNNSGGGVFGSNNNTNTGGFGSNTSAFGQSAGGGSGLFGSKPATGTGIFGSSTSQPAQPAQSGGLFGSAQPSGFGSTGGSGFGAQNNNGGGGLFGSNNNNANKPGFGFGNTGGNTGATSAFGTNNNSGAFGSNNNTGGGLFGQANNQQAPQPGGGMFGNAGQQSTGTSAFGGGNTGFGNQNQQQQGGGLFGSNDNQQKPAGGLFGSTPNNNNNAGGGLFGQPNNNQGSAFGQQNNNQGGGLFGNKPATGTGGLFGNAGAQQNNNSGGGLFGSLGSNNQQQQQPQPGGGMFGGLNTNQQKPSPFGSSTQSTGGGLFGSTNNQSQGNSLFGGSQQQQQQPQGLGGSLFGSSFNNSQSQPQSLTASVNDVSAFGQSSIFGNLPSQPNDPGPLATPLSSKKQARRPSILPLYKLNPASASRFITPQKRGFGFSYSTYGTPNSPSSTASTPAALSGSQTGGSMSRSLGKSVSTNNLRRSLNVDDSLLAPGAFSTSSSSRLFGSNNVKKLVIDKSLRSDLFSTPPKEKTPDDNDARKLSKRVSFDTSNETIENADAPAGSANSTPSAEDMGYIRSSSRGANGSRLRNSSSIPEMEQVKGNELAIVHEEEMPNAGASASPAAADKELGEYWMDPPKDVILKMNRKMREAVPNFTVGRHKSGQVTFKVPVNLEKVDLDNLFEHIVMLETRSCTVYPDPAKKPPVGQGLNVPSLIKLENSWPRSAKGNKKAGASLAKHVDRLRRIEGTKFESYDPDTGVWTFSVEHFTTYALDYDEEDTEDGPPEDEPMRSASHHHDRVEAPSSDSNEESLGYGQGRRAPPGAFDDRDTSYDDEEEGGDDVEMAEVNQPRSSFLGDRSVGSKSKALVPEAQGDMDDEYGMSEQEDASASLEHHQAAEHDDDSSTGSQMDLVQETPGGIMRARMRAIKQSATPMKIQVSTGDDWMDMLQKSISPQKRDRAKLKSLQGEDNYNNMKKSVQERSPVKKRIVSDGRGFATSIDLMKSIFEKGPSEPARPSVAKFAWTRLPKALNEADMNPTDREWHNTLRPTWGPNGTLVFSAAPTETGFGRSGRITERNGLMTVLKGGVVSESQDIRIAKFSNEMSTKALRPHIKGSQVYLEAGIPTVIGPRMSLRDFSADFGGTNLAAEHEKLVWELASVLFDSVAVPSGGDDPVAIEKIRLENLSRFWEDMVQGKTADSVAMAGPHEEKALFALAGHKIPQACKHLLDGKNFRLATLVSLIGANEEVKNDMREQLKEWRDSNVLAEISPPIRALYEMLSGNVCVCEGSKGGSAENRVESFVISRKLGLNWKQAFGLRLWYGTSASDTLADAVQNFKHDVEQEKEQPPMTWYTENKIKPIWNDPQEKKRQDILWGLLQLYADKANTDLEAVLRPENSQLSPLDYRLTWQLGKVLTATGQVSFGAAAQEKADAATLSFASQLTNEGNWLEAVFVLLHLSAPATRAAAVKEHLSRHAGLIGDEKSASFRQLTQDLKIPTAWIWHAKALYERSVKGDHAAEVQCLLRAKAYVEAHRTLIKSVAPKAIIERKCEDLHDLLQQFEGSQSLIPEWNLGGEVYKAFLKLMHHRDEQKRQRYASKDGGKRKPREDPPTALVNGLLDGLPAMHGNTPEASVEEYAALTDMAATVAKAVAGLRKKDKVDQSRILRLPLTEDTLLKHTRDLAWTHYKRVMAGHVQDGGGGGGERSVAV